MTTCHFRFAVTIVLCLCATREAQAFSLIAPPGTTPATDLVNDPENFYSFDEDVITWKMSSLFKFSFDNPILQDQVRLAFGEWSIASDSVLRRDSPRYQWTRWNGDRNFYDLRTVITHELGHMLGAQHPDAAWFNNNYQLSFHPDGVGGWTAGPPLGGEIMNEGNEAGHLPGEKPPKGLRGGEYWRTLSKDELDMLDYVYGRHIDFQEVGENEEAMITLDVNNFFGAPGSGSSLGAAGPDKSELRDPNDDFGGRRLLTSEGGFNVQKPLGIQPLLLGWEFTNHTGKSIDALSIRTEGTSNRNPLETGSQGAHRFTQYDPSNAAGLFDFENVGHHFTAPVGGSIPDGSTVQVGLQQDVWDWYSTSANVRATDGEIFAANLSSIIPWGVSDFLGESPGGADNEDVGRIGQFETVASGFRIVNGDQPTVITEIAIAQVAHMGLGLNDLTSAELARLETLGMLSRVPINPITLAPGDDFVIVLDGDRADLPADLKTRGNYFIFDLPGGFNQGELFAYALSMGANQTLATFGLLNSEPILGHGVPEPSTLFMILAGILTVCFRRLPKSTVARTARLRSLTMNGNCIRCIVALCSILWLDKTCFCQTHDVTNGVDYSFNTVLFTQQKPVSGFQATYDGSTAAVEAEGHFKSSELSADPLFQTAAADVFVRAHANTAALGVEVFGGVAATSLKKSASTRASAGGHVTASWEDTITTHSKSHPPGAVIGVKAYAFLDGSFSSSLGGTNVTGHSAEAAFELRFGGTGVPTANGGLWGLRMTILLALPAGKRRQALSI